MKRGRKSKPFSAQRLAAGRDDGLRLLWSRLFSHADITPYYSFQLASILHGCQNAALSSAPLKISGALWAMHTLNAPLYNKKDMQSSNIGTTLSLRKTASNQDFNAFVPPYQGEENEVLEASIEVSLLV
eukprot:502685-Pelagomonas_calceolata.AAC.2